MLSLQLAASVLLVATSANAYFLMGAKNFLTQQRMDPLVSPNAVSGHVHSVLGGSNFGFNVTTEQLRQSECSSVPIPQDKSNYWFPSFYFQWGNGSFTSLTGGAVIYYLFNDDASVKTTAFPENFRMLTGDPTKRTYDASSFAQQAVTFLCLDFNGASTRHNSIPAQDCPSGIRAQINFPSCWDGKNMDSPDHASHVAFPSDGPDKGTCKDPKFPVTLPRIFIEVYWDTSLYKEKDQAMNKTQPFVLSYGDRTGYGYHADFINGWDAGVLEKVVGTPGCRCNIYGDPTCCADAGIFTFEKDEKAVPCRITNSVDEQVFGTMKTLPGNNPIVEEGQTAKMLKASFTPGILSPVYVYHGNEPDKVGTLTTKPIGSDNQEDGESSAPAGDAASSGAAPSSTTAAGSSSGSGTSSQDHGNVLAGSGQSSSGSGSNSTTKSCGSKKKRDISSAHLKRHHARTAGRRFSDIHA